MSEPPRRRALVVSPDPAAGAGGVERVCIQIAAALREGGWEAEVVGPAEQPGRWPMRLGMTWLAQSRRAMAAARAAPPPPPDLLITHGQLGWPAPRGVRRIHLYHGTMVGHGTRGAVTALRRERVRQVLGGGAAEALAGRGALVAVVAEQVAEEIARWYRLRTDAVLENGVDLATFRPGHRTAARAHLGLDPDTLYALFVGRVEPRKGGDLLAPACARAGFALLVAGAGEVEGARALGVLDPPALARAYAAADAVLFPTRYEGHALVVLEAIACGTPVVTTPTGWVPTLLREVPGYAELVGAPHVDALAARLRRVAAGGLEPTLAAARARVERVNGLDAFGARWRALAERALSAQPSAGAAPGSASESAVRPSPSHSAASSPSTIGSINEKR